MKKRQNTRGYKRYFALDNHREYILVGAQNEAQEWVVVPRRVGIEKFPEWAKLNFREGDIVILETTTNVWATYDIVAPLVSWVLVANAADVGEIAGARVKTDKEDIKRLLTLLFGGIVPEVWVPPVHVRELRAFISYRNRLVATGTMVRNRLQSLLHKHSLLLPEEGILDQAWWDAQTTISALEKLQIRQELSLLDEIEKSKAAVDEELEKQSTGELWGKQALRLMQLSGVGVIVAMTVLASKARRGWSGTRGWARESTTAARPTRTSTSPSRVARNCAGLWSKPPGVRSGYRRIGKSNTKNTCAACVNPIRRSW
jgi:transposase